LAGSLVIEGHSDVVVVTETVVEVLDCIWYTDNAVDNTTTHYHTISAQYMQ